MNYDENQSYGADQDMDGEAMPDLDRLSLPDDALDDDMELPLEDMAARRTRTPRTSRRRRSRLPRKKARSLPRRTRSASAAPAWRI